MWHPLVEVVEYRLLEGHQVWVKFDDGLERVIDFTPVLAGELFGELRSLQQFQKVTLNSEIGTLVWPNGADFDPWTLHEWPHVVDELAARAQTWDTVAVAN